MSTLKFNNVNKIYDNKVQAVFDFNLEVADKEFIVFVGPSGCGKSTTLRMIAGLEDITSGEIYIDDTLINDVPPKDRNIAMVFQNYALYPHMTVYENMAFALKLRKIPKPVLDQEGKPTYTVDKEAIAALQKDIKVLMKENGNQDAIAEIEAQIKELEENPSAEVVKWVHYTKAEINEKIQEAARILGLEPYLKRKPAALSGGQRQRVALGRAIVRNPKVFLMDEPLSNLDAKLRVAMRSEIAKIHERVGATTIYVTHDQTEAMTMATRIVIMKDGYIQQIGSPKEVYSCPNNMFVGGFIGSPAMNFFNGSFDGKNFVFDTEEGENPAKVALNKKQVELLKEYKDKKVVLGVRPEHIYVDIDAAGENRGTEIEMECDISELLGSEFIVYGFINGQRTIVKTNAKNEVLGKSVHKYAFDMEQIHFFDPETTNNIAKIQNQPEQKEAKEEE